MIWAEPVQIEHVCLQFHFPPHHGVLGQGATKTILKAMKPTCNAIPIYSHRRAITHVFQFRRRPIWALKFLLLPSLGFATRLLLSSPPGLCPRTVSRSSGGWRACGATSWNHFLRKLYRSGLVLTKLVIYRFFYFSRRIATFLQHNLMKKYGLFGETKLCRVMVE